MQKIVEQLGSFYLGGTVTDNAEAATVPVLYDARDLTTHAVCVGMTGSGKTGLCVGLLEEAALDRVPALVIDPKGDITNLLLQFPELRPQDFQPWVNVDDARRKGQTIEEYSANTAALWRNGLKEWNIDGERIQALNESADFTIYTPGSDAGAPLNIMGSMAAPQVEFDSDAEMLRERISGTVAALLGLVGINADPVRSQEAVLLATIFETFWRRGEDLDLEKLILAIQSPPVDKLGVFDLETFYPSGDRMKLAMSFNNLVASPAFGEWLDGDPLDIDALLHLEDGTPRHSIFYLAHLSDSERMFFVTLLLENVISWMRRQSGTTSLRALLYFDEVFGFFPPTAEPPSKRPLLTIMKQARAFGLGTVLVSQNPVDIDYKGLANAGTWFIGKMQTERDRARVLSGLEGAIAEAGNVSGDADYDAMIGGLSSREFLMHNVHADAPQVIHTRWVMSYLRGPLTRLQVRELMEAAGKRDRNIEEEAESESGSVVADTVNASDVIASSEAMAEADAAPPGYSSIPPTLADEVTQLFLPISLDAETAAQSLPGSYSASPSSVSCSLVYLPGALGQATVSFVDRRRDIHASRNVNFWLHLSASAELNWDKGRSLPADGLDLHRQPSSVAGVQGPYYAPIPDEMDSLRELRAAANTFSDWLYYGSRYGLLYQEELDVVQHPGESERDYLVRLQQAAREARDAEVDALEDKYEARIDSVQAKMDEAGRRLDELEAKLSSQRQQELIGLGENALQFFLNRRKSRMFSGVGSRRERTMKAHQALETAKVRVADLEADILELNEELEEARSDVTLKWANALDNVETLTLKPRRVDVNVKSVAVGWAPYWLFESSDDGDIVGRLVEAFSAEETSLH